MPKLLREIFPLMHVLVDISVYLYQNHHSRTYYQNLMINYKFNLWLNIQHSNKYVIVYYIVYIYDNIH